jgi:hypothetical protein
VDLFGPRKTVDHAALKAAVRETLQLPEETTVMLSELRCAESGCAPVETVIAALTAGATRQFKIPKPLAEVTRADIQRLSQEFGR